MMTTLYAVIMEFRISAHRLSYRPSWRMVRNNGTIPALNHIVNMMMMTYSFLP